MFAAVYLVRLDQRTGNVFILVGDNIEIEIEIEIEPNGEWVKSLS